MNLSNLSLVWLALIIANEYEEGRFMYTQTDTVLHCLKNCASHKLTVSLCLTCLFLFQNLMIWIECWNTTCCFLILWFKLACCFHHRYKFAVLQSEKRLRWINFVDYGNDQSAIFWLWFIAKILMQIAARNLFKILKRIHARSCKKNFLRRSGFE